MPFNVGPLELVIVLVIALLVIGPKRLPEMGNSIGKTIREFRNASSDVSDAVSMEPESKPVTQHMGAGQGAAPTPAAPAAPASEEDAEPVPTTAEAPPAETTADPKSDA